MTLEDAIKIKEIIEELIVDPEINFGPAYEMTKRRRTEALALIIKEIRRLRNEKSI